MLYLPPCLGSLSALAARESPRYAVTCLRVFEYAEDRYRIEATDGRRLLIVRGQGATEHPSANRSKIRPMRAWFLPNPGRDGFKKLFKKRPGREPCPSACPGAAAFRFSNPSEESTAPNLEERRYPEVNEVIPKKTPAFSVRVDPGCWRNC